MNGRSYKLLFDGSQFYFMILLPFDVKKYFVVIVFFAKPYDRC